MKRLLLTLIMPTIYPAFAGMISVQPATSTISLGAPLSLDVTVSSISDLYAFQFDIEFDPAVLSAITVAEGGLFNSVGVFFSPGFIDNVGGTITFIGDSLSSVGPGINADGTLATILFNGIGSGSSTVDLANVTLLNSSLSDIAVTQSGASVDVTGVPEPATWILLLPVLGVRAFYRRSRGMTCQYD